MKEEDKKSLNEKELEEVNGGWGGGLHLDFSTRKSSASKNPRTSADNGDVYAERKPRI